MYRYALILTLSAAMLACFQAPVKAADQGALTHLASIYTDDKDGAINDPEGVVCNPAGTDIVVADTGNGRLLSYSMKDGEISGGKEIKPPQIAYPLRLQLDSKGGILVLDGKLRRILRLDPQGNFAGYLDPKGMPDKSDVVPRSFKLGSDGNVYVLDVAGWRVLYLDQSGNFQKQYALPKTDGFFCDLCLDKAGELYVLDSVEKVVYKLDGETGKFVPLTKDLGSYCSFPNYMTTDGKGTMYVVDQDGNGIILLGMDGTYKGRRLSIGRSDGFVYYPGQICVDDSGDVVVADRSNSRVQVFKPAQ